MTTQIEISGIANSSKTQQQNIVMPNEQRPTHVPILVPVSIALKIKSRLSQSDFSSVDEYASAVLESLLKELDKDSESTDGKAQERESTNAETDVFSPQDQEDIEERLRGLGYM
ncbi:MAG: hypothetical protein ACREBS_00920 [Nitrososphaerales archaeon]